MGRGTAEEFRSNKILVGDRRIIQHTFQQRRLHVRKRTHAAIAVQFRSAIPCENRPESGSIQERPKVARHDCFAIVGSVQVTIIEHTQFFGSHAVDEEIGRGDKATTSSPHAKELVRC